MIGVKEARELSVANFNKKVNKICKYIDKRIKKVAKRGGCSIKVYQEYLNPEIFIGAIKKYEEAGYKVEENQIGTKNHYEIIWS